MINDGCVHTNSKVLVKGLGETLLPTAQAWELGRAGLSEAAPCTENGHIDRFCYLCPGHALVTKLQDRCVEAR
jgi:hypothetical protein